MSAVAQLVQLLLGALLLFGIPAALGALAQVLAIAFGSWLAARAVAWGQLLRLGAHTAGLPSVGAAPWGAITGLLLGLVGVEVWGMVVVTIILVNDEAWWRIGGLALTEALLAPGVLAVWAGVIFEALIRQVLALAQVWMGRAATLPVWWPRPWSWRSAPALAAGATLFMGLLRWPLLMLPYAGPLSPTATPLGATPAAFVGAVAAATVPTLLVGALLGVTALGSPGSRAAPPVPTSDGLGARLGWHLAARIAQVFAGLAGALGALALILAAFSLAIDVAVAYAQGGPFLMFFPLVVILGVIGLVLGGAGWGADRLGLRWRA